MDIIEKFLELTNKTYPHGTENTLRNLLPSNLIEDKHGNLYINIGVSKCMFTSHLDTACREQKNVNHVFNKHIVKTDGETILGADDKAGVTIMLWMIENNIPGLYYFFLGEEVGCIGSGKVAKDHLEIPLDIEKVISFDRRGTDSIITHQSGLRCCSDEFANKLANELNSLDKNFNYKRDNTGILTDSLEFIDLYAECTNISVGYYNEHTFDEKQDLSHLKRLCDACIMIKWDDLPTVRKIDNRIENDFDKDFDSETYDAWATDEDGNLCKFTTDIAGRVKGAKLTKKRKKLEDKLVLDFLKSIMLDIDKFEWNGATLKVKYKEGNQSSCRRDELYPYIQKLDYREW